MVLASGVGTSELVIGFAIGNIDVTLVYDDCKSVEGCNMNSLMRLS